MDFSKTIQIYISQGEQIKSKYKKYWKDEYDVVISDLEQILNLIDLDEDKAKSDFGLLEISKSKDFISYIQKKDINVKKIKIAINNTHKGRKQLVCRHCSSTFMYIKQGVFVCKQCGAEITSRSNTQLLAKETTDNSKHIVKQLNTLIGKNNPPQMLLKIFPFLREWFFDRSYLYNYLKYINKVESWIKKYNSFVDKKQMIDENYFSEKIIRDIDHIYPYKIFKLYTQTFHEIILLCEKISSLTNNMYTLTNEKVIEICQNYMDEFNKIPEIYDIYSYNGVKYEIGKYINSLMITDLHSKGELKQNLNNVFKTELTLPGLLFDYIKLYGNDTIPKTFIYQQNYLFIIHEIFNIPYNNIIESDKQTICDIIMKFNSFVKEIKTTYSGKHHNSCLWQISLMYVFKLPWFKCYENIIKILPIKTNENSSNIETLWIKFNIIHHQYLSKFTTQLRKTIPKDETKTTVIKEEINKQELMNFINQTGEYYNNSKDNYLRNKLNVKEVKHDWTKKYDDAYISDLIKEKELNEQLNENMDEFSEEYIKNSYSRKDMYENLDECSEEYSKNSYSREDIEDECSEEDIKDSYSKEDIEENIDECSEEDVKNSYSRKNIIENIEDDYSEDTEDEYSNEDKDENDLYNTNVLDKEIVYSDDCSEDYNDF